MSAIEVNVDTTLRRAFAAHIARLPSLQARAFRLRDVEGWTPARICAHMGISDEALSELLYEARVAMCGALAREAPTR